MITFKQFLAEAFDRPYPFDKEIHRESLSQSMFKVDGVAYIIDLNNDYRDINVTLMAYIDGEYTVLPTNISKSPNRIYATVYVALKKFMNMHKGEFDRIRFEAVVSRTRPLYEKLAKRFAADTGGEFKLATGGVATVVYKK